MIRCMQFEDFYDFVKKCEEIKKLYEKYCFNISFFSAKNTKCYRDYIYGKKMIYWKHELIIEYLNGDKDNSILHSICHRDGRE